MKTVSDKIDVLIQRKKKELAERLDDPYCNLGLYKQHDLQLRMMETASAADVELIISPMTGKSVTNTTKPYITLATGLSRPWSRGTVVSISLRYA